MIKESDYENEVVNKLESMGWEKINDINRNGYTDVFDFGLLKKSIISINGVNDQIADEAIKEIRKNNADIVTMNKISHSFLHEGVKVFDKKSKLTKSIKLISSDSSKNTYNLIQQFKISDSKDKRIPDIVLFINGLPVVVMELKSPTAYEDTNSAFKQNESLKVFSPKLWSFNIINFISNRTTSMYGTVTSNYKIFHCVKNLKTRDNKNIFEFLFSFESIYKFICLYSFYAKERNTYKKYIAAPHQIEAVQATINRLKNNTSKGGVVWHTQGSGKSVTMLILARAIIDNFNKSTIVVITDRTNLDNQLFSRFLNANNYLRNDAEQIKSRDDLINKLNEKQHFGIYFSTVQKFTDNTGVLSERNDVFVLVDEAHRSQNNIEGESFLSADKKDLVTKYGYARYMRDAFPNAKMVGFTGTPLMKADKNTKNIFGDYNHRYLMSDSVNDGTTVPIFYEMRKLNLGLNDEYLSLMDKIQNDYIMMLDEDDVTTKQKVDELEKKSIILKEILEDEKIVKAKAKDILSHLEKRSLVLHGKSLIVANSRLAAYRYYKSLTELKPDLKEKIILVITENNKDLEEMSKAIVPKRDIIITAEEFRKDNSKYQIAIVVDMWLTGFDVQDLDTLYIDKIIKWHNLMQAIARVNRTYEGKDGKTKESGLIVDYVLLWKHITNALAQYANKNNSEVDLYFEDINEAKENLKNILRDIESSYISNLSNLINFADSKRYEIIMNAYDLILGFDKEERQKYIKLARNVNKFFKISYTILDKEMIYKSRIVISVNRLLLENTTRGDQNLQSVIEKIKDFSKMAIELKDEDVYVSETKISKNINDVYDVLMREAEQLKNTKSNISLDILTRIISYQIDSIKNIKPFFASKISNKLILIIENLQKTEDIENVFNQLRILSNEVVAESKKELEFKEPQLNAFFNILVNDEYLKESNNSEVLKELTKELVGIVRKNGVDLFEINPKVKGQIKLDFKKLLLKKHNYPSEQLDVISVSLIDELTNQIEINKEFFKEENK